MQEDIVLRYARKCDAKAIHALLWAAKETIPLKPNFCDDDHFKLVEKWCCSCDVWCVVQKTVIIGAMVMQENKIFYLVVSPDHQRKGFARKLVKKAKDICKERGVTADVAPNNEAIKELLKAEGFQDNGSFSEWYIYSWNPV